MDETGGTRDALTTHVSTLEYPVAFPIFVDLDDSG